MKHSVELGCTQSQVRKGRNPTYYLMQYRVLLDAKCTQDSMLLVSQTMLNMNFMKLGDKLIS